MRALIRRAAAILLFQGRPLALLVFAAVVGLRALDPSPVEDLRFAYFDILQKRESRMIDSPGVVVVAIDEPSLKRYGQWPWPRFLLARLVNRIAAQKPVAIGFDMIFAEPDRFSPDAIVDALPELSEEVIGALRTATSSDAMLAEAMAKTTIVLAAAGISYSEDVDRSEALPHANIAEVGADPRPFLPRYNTLIRSIDPLVAAAKTVASISIPAERDAAVRRLPLVVNVAGTLYPTLSLDLLRIAAGSSLIKVISDTGGVQAVEVGPLRIPTAPDGRVWLHHARSAPERYVSAADVLEGAVQGKFENRVVLVGATALALGDVVATPVELRIPGVEIHAQFMESAAAGTLIERPRWSPWGETGLAALFAVALVVVVPMLPPAGAFAAALGMVAATAAGGWFGFKEAGLLLDATYPAAATIATFAAVLTGTLAAAEAARRALRDELERQKLAAERLEGELAAAREIQLGSVPRIFPAFPHRAELDIHAVLEPARAVGGDFYDFLMVGDDRLFFVVGDVSGKGVPAALFMALSKALTKSSAVRHAIDVGTAVTEANVEIARENSASMFVTVLAGSLDLATGALQIANAGHDAPILLRGAEMPVQLAGEGGPPLCALDDFTYETERHALRPGDAIVLVTDGVTEAMDPRGGFYSSDRLRVLLQGLPAGVTAKAIAEGIVEDLRVFAAGAEQADDITILVIRYMGKPAG